MTVFGAAGEGFSKYVRIIDRERVGHGRGSRAAVPLDKMRRDGKHVIPIGNPSTVVEAPRLQPNGVYDGDVSHIPANRISIITGHLFKPWC
jgi:hypothetical protein